MILSEKDRTDLCKFLKYFVYKSCHVLVQSRNGKKANDRSKLIASSSDWFNLLIRDLSDLQSEIKKAYSQHGGLQVGRKPITLEFSFLQKPMNKNANNASGKKVILEAWSIRMANEVDNSVKVSFGVYNRLSTLLKNIIVISRTLPLYKVKSNANNLEIGHSFMVGETLIGKAGVEFEVGRVGTPMGTVVVSSFTNAITIQNLKRILKSSNAVTDCILLDHFANDYYEYDDPSFQNFSGSHSNDIVEHSDEGKDIVIVTKDDKGNVIIKNHCHEENPMKKKNKNDENNNLNNIDYKNDIINNNKKKFVNESDRKSAVAQQEKFSPKVKKYSNGIESEKKFTMVNYEDFDDEELGEFYKQFKEAEKNNLFSSNNKVNNKVYNKKFEKNAKKSNENGDYEEKILFDSEKGFARSDVNETNSSINDKNDKNNNNDYDICSLSNTLAEFEANAVQFDAFVQSIDNIIALK